jgi:hypothetical protein
MKIILEVADSCAVEPPPVNLVAGDTVDFGADGIIVFYAEPEATAIRIMMAEHQKKVQAAIEHAAHEIPVLEGRRCPKCQSLMMHTRLGGYRCPRGCQ